MATTLLAILLSAFAAPPDPNDDPATGAGITFPLHLAEELQQEPKTGLDDAAVERDFRRKNTDDDLIVNFGLHGRFSIPFGAANRSYSYYGGGYYYIDHYSSWSDFFNPGFGFELEADIFFGKNGPGHRRQPGFNYGLAVILQADEYYGRSNNDSFGNSLNLEDMSMTTLQIGGRVIQTAGDGMYFGGLVALGAVHYSEVVGTFSGPLFTQFRDSFLKDTWTFASTFRGDAGYRIGPLGLVIGMGLRIMAPPNEGGRFDMNSGAFWTFDIDLGLEIGF